MNDRLSTVTDTSRRIHQPAFWHLPGKLGNVLRRLLQAYGTPGLKRSLWNSEFAGGEWQCLETSSGDPVYFYLEKYAKWGSILDLGCGSGSTGNEVDANAYSYYLGVDISDVAIAKATTRSMETGRAGKNHYFRSDISSYVPDRQFDVVLLRDSVYYVPWSKVKAMLDGYAQYLTAEGVFIVRMWNASGKYQTIVDTIESNFEIVEKYWSSQPEAMIIVFRKAAKPIP